MALLAPGAARAGSSDRVAVFYYPWYGTPARDGAYQHWQQAGHAPPADLATSYFPALGAYSSSDESVLAAQMDEIALAGAGDVVSSWWGWGSPEDRRLPSVIRAAAAHGLTVDVQLEPYRGRTIESIAADIAHLRGLGIRTFYVYRPHDLPDGDWARLNGGLRGVVLYAQTTLVGRAAAGRFTGIYTYDILTYDGSKLARLCAQAHAARLLCAPSVGPGYQAERATGDARMKPRRNGATYDAMWTAALAANPDEVTITSFNEWHEGTQIEPARPERGYASYDGAYGLRGAAAEGAYLLRTAFWAGLLVRRDRAAAAPGRLNP